MTAPLRGVMIGAGFFAKFQAEAWMRIEGVDIVAVADPVPGRAAAFAAGFGIPRSYTDAGAMLRTEAPDFTDIVTRPESHRQLTEMASAHCRAVICQKPMAPTLAQCEAMINCCSARNVRLIVHENWRWQPWYREAKWLLEGGVAGTVFHLGFHMRTGDGRGPDPYGHQPYFRDMPRLLLYETAVHFIDTFRFFAGDLESVFCQTSRINGAIRGEDYALVQVAFHSGSRGLIDANRISGDFPPQVAFGEFRMEGTEAAIRIAPDGSIFIRRYGEPEEPHAWCPPTHGYKGDSVAALQRHIVECLLSGRPAEPEAAAYLPTVIAVDACYRSAETDSVVSLR